MECLVLIEDVSTDNIFVLYNNLNGHPEYTGNMLKAMFKSFPYDKFNINYNVVIEELTKYKGFILDYDMHENMVDEDEVDENKIQPYKYVYIISIDDKNNSVKYKYKKIDNINFPSFEDLQNYEDMDITLFN